MLAEYLASRNLNVRSAYQIRLCWRRFSEHLTREPCAADFSDVAINAFLSAYASGGRSARTVRNFRHILVGIWKHGYAHGLTEDPPRNVKRITVPRKIPEAWSRQEAAKLIRAAGKLKGKFGRVPRRVALRALWMVAYDTGLRSGDLFSLRKSDLRGRNITLVIRKTGLVHSCRLSLESRNALLEVCKYHKKERIFGDLCGSRQWYEARRECLALAGLEGGLQKMRRTGATAVEAVRRGAAMQFLGHRTAGLAYLSYVDPRLLAVNLPSPPPLNV